ncbi:MAG: hypothetical protein LBM16_05175 [Clostridiales bacterium]|jgi:HPt (histidine-containing phosphotransfer) domain-containing protein|nr:hypothetical protein [Clostridiales bacterium]
MNFINIDDLSSVNNDPAGAERLLSAVGDIKFSEGARRFANKRDKYVAALYKFASSLSVPEFSTAQTNPESLRIAIHTIKGTAGNLAVYSIHYAAKDFEDSIKENAPDKALHDKLCFACDEFKNYILSVIKKAPAEALDKAPKSEAIELLTQLEQYLLMSEAAKCEEITAVIKKTDFDGIRASSLEIICDCVDDYDYDLALDLIRNIIKK